MGSTIKLGAIIGGAYAAGSMGGAKLADALKVSNEAARTGIKIGTGVVAYVVIMAVLG